MAQRILTDGRTAPAVLERVIRRDRVVVAAALIVLVALAWAYLHRMASGMSPDAMETSMDMPGMQAGGMEMGMPQMGAWTGTDLMLLFVMWAVMMVAMMLPSAAPMILLFASIHQRRRERAGLAVPTGVFVAGYLLVWTVFSGFATLTQWGLHRAALLSPAMATTSALLGGLLLIAAGAYQWTPLKRLCLTHCRSPLGFLTSEWREGARGALVMGLRHGAFCLGCCWVLMALLFVAGVMNLFWVAAIAGIVLVEKVAPAGVWIGRAAGVFLAVWGAWMFIDSLF